jgi:hypothetical protein
MSSDLEQFDDFTRPTLSALQEVLPFDDAVLYALLHEPLYCQGYFLRGLFESANILLDLRPIGRLRD